MTWFQNFCLDGNGGAAIKFRKNGENWCERAKVEFIFKQAIREITGKSTNDSFDMNSKIDFSQLPLADPATSGTDQHVFVDYGFVFKFKKL